MTPESQSKGVAESAVTTHPVEDREALEHFLEVPARVFADDPAWIPPLKAEQRAHFLRRRNPFFRHAEVRLWTVWRGGEPVGRISAQIDALYLEHHGDACGFFGCLDGVDDPVVFGTLLTTAEEWLRERGMARVRGPFSLSINDECGLLVAGFKHPPRVLMGHNRPYYADHLAAAGYCPTKDLLAYRLAVGFAPPRTMQRLETRFARRITIRVLRRRWMGRELTTLRRLFNEAWAGNWGFVPFTAAEFAQLGNLFRLLVPRSWVRIAELDGAPAGMIVLLPDLNQAIADLQGQLSPSHALRLLWRLAWVKVTRGRVALMGVLPELQRTALGATLTYQLIASLQGAAQARGLAEVELSWILEDNQGMRRIVEELGAACYKRYRLMERELAS